jgi:hypothetical protein
MGGDAAWARVRERLAPREVEVVGPIFQGFRNREIAVAGAAGEWPEQADGVSRSER